MVENPDSSKCKLSRTLYSYENCNAHPDHELLGEGKHQGGEHNGQVRGDPDEESDILGEAASEVTQLWDNYPANVCKHLDLTRIVI